MNLSTNYDSELASLSSKVNDISPSVNKESVSNTTSKFDFLTKYNVYENGVYIVIPFVIFSLMFFFKPSFVSDTKTNEDGEDVVSKSWSKMFTWTILVSLPLIVGLYIFFKKRKVSTE
jgi:hypothetical protein